jgi:hypothetical protein
VGKEKSRMGRKIVNHRINFLFWILKSLVKLTPGQKGGI